MTTTRVQDLMTAPVATLARASSVTELLDLLHERDIRHVPITDGDGDLLGLVTDRDILRGALSDSQVDLPQDLRARLQSAHTVEALMSTDVVTVEPEALLAEAAGLLADHKIGCLPVTIGGKLVGILTETDIARWVSENA